MAKTLLSVGLYVGTTSTQLILSRLTAENKAGALQAITSGSKMAFSLPWGMWNIPPKAWDRAWHSPKPD